MVKVEFTTTDFCLTGVKPAVPISSLFVWLIPYRKEFLINGRWKSVLGCNIALANVVTTLT
ncbi:hypothetical protein MFFC18_40460 [Mariniblastus fucicola]|uniref:Uncharacterized protein n=1 Tax=Mariniblastus fucicola TaxID=980251 RepID=A0A5B9PFY8_9BACT|nr:hypothetical protein MFFC18_40460 [Mariniblastus fucicola]